MTLNIDSLLPASDPKPTRLLIDVELKPVQGSRFQPTGFPDLGAAVFETSEGTRLLVESAQSMANRLEATIWDGAKGELLDVVKGISYVRVERPDQSYLTSSVTEAHRLNSPYILESKKDTSVLDALKEQAKAFDDARVDRRKLAEIVFGFDANALLHGLFLAKKELAGGRLRVERALSAFIEAEGVRVAASGGVKNDHIDAAGEAEKGFGNVPFQRDEYTAKRITAYFSLDLAQIRGYALGQDAERLLVALALYKISTLLDGGLRLRTACDLEMTGSMRIKRPEGFTLPSLEALSGSLPKLVGACAAKFKGTQGVTRVTYAA